MICHRLTVFGDTEIEIGPFPIHTGWPNAPARRRWMDSARWPTWTITRPGSSPGAGTCRGTRAQTRNVAALGYYCGDLNEDSPSLFLAAKRIALNLSPTHGRTRAIRNVNPALTALALANKGLRLSEFSSKLHLRHARAFTGLTEHLRKIAYRTEWMDFSIALGNATDTGYKAKTA